MRLACNGLLSWFEKKATIITPSRLTAAAASQQFANHQLQGGMDSWERPAVYHVEGWLGACWQEARWTGQDVGALLSRAQEQVVWQQIIERNNPDLFDIASTARLASQAARVVAEWRIPLTDDAWEEHHDAQQFREWHAEFGRRRREGGWLARWELWRMLPQWIADGLCGREQIVFAGFDAYSPALTKIRRALQHSAEAETMSEQPAPHSAPSKQAIDWQAEIETAARWARATFEQRPDDSIAVFLPNLAEHRPSVERTFQKIFYSAGALKIASVPDTSVFHSSRSAALNMQPLVANAMLLLELGRQRLAVTDGGAILRCPFIAGAAAERSVRAKADLDLRRRRDIDVSLKDIEDRVRHTQLAARLAKVRLLVANMTGERELAEWSESMADLLEAMGWPGEADLDDREQEVVGLWKDALSELASLGMVANQVTYREALAQFWRLLSVGAVEIGDWRSPVQILDAGEGAGLQFDHALVMGLSDGMWPIPAKPSPFIPLKLQRAQGVTGSSPEFAQVANERATRMLFASAADMAATYTGRLASIAKPYTRENTGELAQWPGKLPKQLYAPALLEEIEDACGPEYVSTEPLRGGTAIIKAQSQCPFRAFAEFRLRSDTPEEACFGFDSRDRGGFLHSALQAVWKNLRTQERLKTTADAELRDVVHDAVLQAVQDDTSSPFHELVTQAERERLQKAILEWLYIEKTRSQPFSVEFLEDERYFDLAGLRLRMRIDRIDKLRNGDVVLIDYKSGEQKRKNLEGERPREPQLLVYAASVGEKVEGIFFGQVKSRDMRAVGYSSSRHFRDRTATVDKNWDQYLARSRANVERIAHGFASGQAAVDPLSGACDFCQQKPLCRVNEKPAGIAETDEQD